MMNIIPTKHTFVEDTILIKSLMIFKNINFGEHVNIILNELENKFTFSLNELIYCLDFLYIIGKIDINEGGEILCCL